MESVEKMYCKYEASLQCFTLYTLSWRCEDLKVRVQPVSVNAGRVEERLCVRVPGGDVDDRGGEVGRMARVTLYVEGEPV